MGRHKEKIKHGTAYGYQGRGCRCKLCKRAQTDRLRAYRAKKREALAASEAASADEKDLRTTNE